MIGGVRFVDLKRQTAIYKNEFMNAIERVLTNADFIQGKEVNIFEENFAKYCNKKYCIAVNSGTDALEFALRAYGIGPGDEVITAPNSYFSTAMVISKVGAIPIFADVNPFTYNIEPEEINKKISAKTKAIIPVHLCGQPAKMNEIIKIAQSHNLIIIEDCCQAVGSEYKHQIVPFTETGCFSGYPGKNLGGFGDNGWLVTDNEEVYKKCLLLRNDGSVEKYHHEIIGSKSRMDTIQAAILNIKLKYINVWNALRRQHAKLYTKLLEPLEAAGYIILPEEENEVTSNYHLYMIQAKERDKLQKWLDFERNISTVIHYPIPIHLQPAYANLGYKKGDFQNTESLAERIISLPMFPELTNEEIEYICSKITRFYELLSKEQSNSQ